MVLIVGVCFQAAYAGNGYVEIVGSGADKKAQSYIYSSDNYHYLAVFFYKNSQIAETNNHSWGYYISPHNIETNVETLSVNDAYYGYSAHGTGPIYAVCDDEWTSSTSVRTYTGKSYTAISGEKIEYDRLKLISTKIAKYYDLNTENFTYYNIIDIIQNKVETEFTRTLGVEVVAEFHKILKIGDYAPSFWVDSSNNTVYIGSKLVDDSYLLYSSNWEFDKEGRIYWTELCAVK